MRAPKTIAHWCNEGDWIRDTLFVIHNNLTIIHGRRPHCVMPYTGERFSLVYFVHNSGVAYEKRQNGSFAS